MTNTAAYVQGVHLLLGDDPRGIHELRFGTTADSDISVLADMQLLFHIFAGASDSDRISESVKEELLRAVLIADDNVSDAILGELREAKTLEQRLAIVGRHKGYILAQCRRMDEVLGRLGGQSNRT